MMYAAPEVSAPDSGDESLILPSSRQEKVRGAISDALGPRFASAAIYSLAGGVASQALNMLGMSAAAILLGSESFGQFALVQNTTSMLGVLGGAGAALTATSHIPRFRMESPERAARIIGACSALGWGAGLLLTAVLFLAAPLIANAALHDPAITGLLRIAALSVLFQAVFSAQLGSLAGLEAFPAIAVINSLRGLVSVILIPLATWLWGLHGAVGAMVLWSALVCAGVELLLRRQCLQCDLKPRLRHVVFEFRLLTASSLPVFLSSVIVGPTSWIASALLAKQPGGFAELGIYAAAERWRLAILFAPTCLAAITLPRLSSRQAAAGKFGSGILVCTALVALIAAIPCVPVIALATPLMSVLGDGYAKGGPALILLAASGVAGALNTALGQSLLSSNLAWLRFAVDALLSAAFLGLCFWLIPIWKASGMAGACLVSYILAVCVLGLFTPWVVRRAEAQACRNPGPEGVAA